jgi:hypothetical protein
VSGSIGAGGGERRRGISWVCAEGRESELARRRRRSRVKMEWSGRAYAGEGGGGRTAEWKSTNKFFSPLHTFRSREKIN